MSSELNYFPENTTEYPEYYKKYIELVGTPNLLSFLKEQVKRRDPILEQILELQKADFKYAENKWTIKELIGHLVDTERIMMHRAFSFARGEQQLLPGFDENQYVLNANFDSRNITQIFEEWNVVRLNSIFLIQTFSQEALNNIGSASTYQASCRAVLYLMAGHEEHHLNILKERYI